MDTTGMFHLADNKQRRALQRWLVASLSAGQTPPSFFRRMRERERDRGRKLNWGQSGQIPHWYKSKGMHWTTQLSNQS